MLSKRNFEKIVLLLFLGIWAFTCQGQIPGSRKSDLDQFYHEKNYFGLREAYKRYASILTDVDRLVYKAVLDNAFNQCSASLRSIHKLKTSYSSMLSDSLKKTLFNLAADNQIKLYHYKEAADCYKAIIDSCKIDSTERDDVENSRILWGAVAEIPPQEVIRDASCVVPWKKDKMGLVQIAVTHKTDSCDMVFDTGANLSVITESSAKKLHMKIYPVKLDLAGIGGKTVKSSLAVADSLSIGNIFIRHAVFLLLPDKMLYFEHVDYQQQGIIGQPIMAQLGEIDIDGDRKFRVPLHAQKSNLKNMALDGPMPIIQYTVQMDSLSFRFDTGATTSILYAPFYRRYKQWIDKQGTPYVLKTAGVGGEVSKSKAYTLHNFTIGLGSRSLSLGKINARTTDVDSGDDIFYGNMGLDLFGKFKSVIINFDQMYVAVK